MGSARSEDPVLVRIHRLSRSLLRASTALYLREFDLGVPHIQILNSIANHGHIVSKDIAEILSMNKGLVSRSLSELTERGYAESVRDPNDARRRVWALTGRGQDFIAKWRPVGLKRQHRFLKVLTDDERSMLVDILDKLTASSERLRIEETPPRAKRTGPQAGAGKRARRTAYARPGRSRQRSQARTTGGLTLPRLP